MVVESPVGQYIAMGRGGFGGGGGGGFPSSLMGVIAYIRQVYLDADHYKLVKEAYAKNPRGMERPEYDRALEGVLESKRILLPANRLVEIDRMMRFAARAETAGRFSTACAKPTAPKRPTLLKKSGLPVLVSLQWPDAADRSRRSPGRRKHAPACRPATRRPPLPRCCRRRA